MIAVTLIEYLEEELELPVYMEQPEELTDYILIDQTGSMRSNYITTTDFAISSYASSLYEAMTMNESLKTAMEGLLELGEIAKVDLETDYNFTDTTTKQYRWQAVYHITHYN